MNDGQNRMNHTLMNNADKAFCNGAPHKQFLDWYFDGFGDCVAQRKLRMQSFYPVSRQILPNTYTSCEEPRWYLLIV